MGFLSLNVCFELLNVALCLLLSESHRNFVITVELFGVLIFLEKAATCYWPASKGDSPVPLDQLLFKTRDESLNLSVNRTVFHYFLPVFHLSVSPLSNLEVCVSAHHILLSTGTVPQNKLFAQVSEDRLCVCV